MNIGPLKMSTSPNTEHYGLNTILFLNQNSSDYSLTAWLSFFV